MCGTVNIDKAFLGAGRAVFTVSNPSGEHYTYRIGKPRDESPWFVSLLTGPDNTTSYTYLGVYDPLKATVRLTTKSAYKEDSRPVRVLAWAVGLIHSCTPPPDGYAIRHEGRCGRCGRRLTVPASLATGMGPECSGRKSLDNPHRR